jgi:hypothetical protein
MSKVVRCYGSKRRAVVDQQRKLNPLVSELVADALEHDESNVRLVKACDLVLASCTCTVRTRASICAPLSCPFTRGKGLGLGFEV